MNTQNKWQAILKYIAYCVIFWNQLVSRAKEMYVYIQGHSILGSDVMDDMCHWTALNSLFTSFKHFLPPQKNINFLKAVICVGFRTNQKAFLYKHKCVLFHTTTDRGVISLPYQSSSSLCNSK